jgi:hypothetical protein
MKIKIIMKIRIGEKVIQIIKTPVTMLIITKMVMIIRGILPLSSNKT